MCNSSVASINVGVGDDDDSVAPAAVPIAAVGCGVGEDGGVDARLLRCNNRVVLASYPSPRLVRTARAGRARNEAIAMT